MARLYADYFQFERKAMARGFIINRHNLAKEFTNGEKDGISEMGKVQYTAFVQWCNERMTAGNLPMKPENAMRRKVIAMLTQVGYVNDQGKADMVKIDGWCRKYSPYKKRLQLHDKNELVSLVNQAEQYNKRELA